MAYPAFPTFPASTRTSFDDLMTVRKGDPFVLGGFEYRAMEDAYTRRDKGVETVHIKAKRRHAAMPSGWELADAIDWRAYVGTLDEICD